MRKQCGPTHHEGCACHEERWMLQMAAVHLRATQAELALSELWSKYTELQAELVGAKEQK